jgi:hypothetical protein
MQTFHLFQSHRHSRVIDSDSCSAANAVRWIITGSPFFLSVWVIFDCDISRIIRYRGMSRYVHVA